MAKQVRRWVFRGERGGPELEIVRLRAPARHEVLLTVLHFSICREDILMARGKWDKGERGAEKQPFCGGHQVVGVVSELGEGVSSVQIGQVAGVYQGTDRIQGGFSEGLIVNQKHVFVLPEGLNPKTSPPFFCAGVSAFSILNRHGKKEGERIAVAGVGGFGHMLVMLAAKMGYKVDVFTRSEDRESEFKKLGAQRVVVMREDTDLRAFENSYSLVVICHYSEEKDHYDRMFKLCGFGADFVLVGTPHGSVSLSFQLDWLKKRRVRIVGASVTSNREGVMELLEFAAKRGIEPWVEHMSFSNFEQAFEKAEFQRPKFKVVVSVQH